jgi:flagellar basal body-associated protein FliL
MDKKSIPARIFWFYVEGFQNMTLGKILWLIILIKIFTIFIVLKIFFFPHYLNKFDTQSEKQKYVSSELIKRANLKN